MLIPAENTDYLRLPRIVSPVATASHGSGLYPMKIEGTAETGAAMTELERRQQQARRILGRLVSLDGTYAARLLRTRRRRPGEYWSVGNLITVVHDDFAPGRRGLRSGGRRRRLAQRRRQPGDRQDRTRRRNRRGRARQPDFSTAAFAIFRRSARVAHRIRASDLKAIYQIRGEEGVEFGRLTQNPDDPGDRQRFGTDAPPFRGRRLDRRRQVDRRFDADQAMRPQPAEPARPADRSPQRICAAISRRMPSCSMRTTSNSPIGCSGSTRSPTSSTPAAKPIRTSSTRSTRSSAPPRPASPAAPSGGSPESSIRRQTQADQAWISADTPVPYRVSDAVQIIDEWMGKLDPRYARADMRSLRNRIESLSHDPRYRFMFGRLMVEDNFAKVLGPDVPPADGRASGIDHADWRGCRTKSSIRWCRCSRASPSTSRPGAAGPTRSPSSARRRTATFPPIKRRASSRPGARSAGSRRRAASTACRSASSRSGRPSSTRPCSPSARRCLRCGLATSATRTSFLPRRASRRAARSASCRRSPTAKRSPSAKRSRRRCG